VTRELKKLNLEHTWVRHGEIIEPISAGNDKILPSDYISNLLIIANEWKKIINKHVLKVTLLPKDKW
jgi:hypothetical protein